MSIKLAADIAEHYLEQWSKEDLLVFARDRLFEELHTQFTHEQLVEMDRLNNLDLDENNG